MINRCYNIKADRYNCYGKVGVTVCDEWKNSFENFYKWAINQEFQIGMELDKDIKSDELKLKIPIYSPSTCTFLSKEDHLEYTNYRTLTPCFIGYNIYTLKKQEQFIGSIEFKKIYGDSNNTLGKHIRRCIRNNEYYTHNEMFWRLYKDEKSILETIELPNNPKYPIVQQWNKDKSILIKEYFNATEAAKSLGKERPRLITKACKEQNKIAYGFIWKYKYNK